MDDNFFGMLESISMVFSRAVRVPGVEDSLLLVLESISEVFSVAEMMLEVNDSIFWVLGSVSEVSRGSTNSGSNSVLTRGILDRIRRIIRRCIMLYCWRLTRWSVKVYFSL